MSLTILATNDDGIDAPGLQVLARELSTMEGARVYVVAPGDEWSARGHAITIKEPIYVDKREGLYEVPAWEISGSPADCVKLGLNHLVPEEVDMVVAGINNGPNLATDVLYSGTVAAAIEAVLARIPSLAVSLGVSSDCQEDYRAAGRVARILVESFQGQEPFPLHLLNVNVPLHPRGIEFTELGPCPYDDNIETAQDAEGNACYWLRACLAGEGASDGTDLAALARGHVSITPLEFFDITDRALRDEMASMAGHLEARLSDPDPR